MRNASRHLGDPLASIDAESGHGSRPLVLFLSCHLPWPALSGGRRRELELLTRLGRRFDVHLVVVSKTVERDRANAHALRRFCRAVEVFPATPLTPAASETGQPAQVCRHRSPAATGRVGEILAHDPVELIHVEGYYLMQHVPDWAEVPVLLVEQNVEYDLERQRAAAGCRGSLSFSSAFAQCVRTRTAELACWSRASRVAAVTAEDRTMIAADLPDRHVALVPDGADHVARPDAAAPRRRVVRPAAPLAMMLANFAYAPNVDAASYLSEEILPLVHARIPELRVWLVGNDPPPAVRALEDQRVRVTGFVPDVVPYLDAADVILCPLRIGGGVKVKAIEALRRGKAVVSSSVGAQGLPPQALRIADAPHDFAAAVETLVRDRAQRTRLEQRAAAAAAELPSWDDAATALFTVYDELLAPAARTGELVGIGATGRST